MRVRVSGATCVVAAWREVVRGEAAAPATFQVRDGIRLRVWVRMRVRVRVRVRVMVRVGVSNYLGLVLGAFGSSHFATTQAKRQRQRDKGQKTKTK